MSAPKPTSREAVREHMRTTMLKLGGYSPAQLEGLTDAVLALMAPQPDKFETDLRQIAEQGGPAAVAFCEKLLASTAPQPATGDDELAAEWLDRYATKSGGKIGGFDALVALLDRVRADERERCAVICEQQTAGYEFAWQEAIDACHECAAAIRSDAREG